MSRWHSYGVGQYRPSEGHLLIANRLYKPDATKRAIIVCPPRGQVALQAHETGWAGTVLSALAEAGFPVLAIDCGGGTAHGNAAAAQAIGEGRTYAGSAFGAKIDAIGLFATSMGALGALRYAMVNPANVACFVGIVPSLDLQDIHDVTRPDLSAEIETAHGGLSGYSTYLTSYNPSDHTEDLATLPQQIHYATNDPNFTPTVAPAYIDATGAEGYNMGAVGHTPVNADAAAVTAFFEEHLT